MDKEMDQELEWLEAQKIEISVDLFSAAKQQLQFLGAVDRNRWLYDGPALERAIYRYNAYWLPLLANYTESSSTCQGPLVPPLDCEWVWHCHRLNPVRYKTDCEELYGRLLDNSGVLSSVNGSCNLQTENLWKRLYPMEPYDLDLNKAISKPEDTSVLEKRTTTYDLVSAVKRQCPFYYQVSRAHVDNEVFLQEAVARYKAFLYLIKRNRENSIKLFCVPTYDIDLIWHTHQLHAVSYCKDLTKMIGNVLEHDDTDSDRSKGKKLDTGFSGTTSQWEETFGRRYWKAGAMNRGDTPKPVTTSPYVFLGKKLPAKEDAIKFPEVKVIEVVLEIVGVKNLPDTHKGNVFIVFSKTQPDSLFNTERNLTACGEKQVAMFKCEPTGELSFQLMSSKSKTLLGSASLSLSEFLCPVTRLSVEKWLELTTPVQRGKAISLRVAVSFTPPTRSPTVLHLVQARPSVKDSCFFPMLGNVSKSFTRVVDETETELISLHMRNHNNARQVIGVKESGETLVLATYDGCVWSLLEAKWSLKQTSSLDGPVFEIFGVRMVKVYYGRKLVYETKRCAKLRSEQDFMTAVEFSKQYPYGKAVGLLDLKFGSFEANERWLVLPGLVSAFILNDLLKNEGFCGAAKDIVKGNGITVKLEEETMMHVNINGGARCLSKELNSGNMVEEEGGGSCTGGSTGCGGCGGAGGGCGNMMTNENVPSLVAAAEAPIDAVAA
ncbi:Glycine-rich domain-containing protein 2 [Raphanus sativus]|nr:Glycine-rich domain-containing protein 2 [Raphanus sativus]